MWIVNQGLDGGGGTPLKMVVRVKLEGGRFRESRVRECRGAAVELRREPHFVLRILAIGL